MTVTVRPRAVTATARIVLPPGHRAATGTVTVTVAGGPGVIQCVTVRVRFGLAAPPGRDRGNLARPAGQRRGRRRRQFTSKFIITES